MNMLICDCCKRRFDAKDEGDGYVLDGIVKFNLLGIEMQFPENGKLVVCSRRCLELSFSDLLRCLDGKKCDEIANSYLPIQVKLEEYEYEEVEKVRNVTL